MRVEQGDRHILRHAELRGRHRVSRQFVGGDGERDDVARLHRVSGEFRGGHRVGNQLFSGHRICCQLVHRDGIGLDLFSGHGIHGEMLRSHRTRRENVVRHEVERREARAIPSQHLNHAVCERHQNARRIVRCSLPVCVEVGHEARRIVLLALPPRPILLRAPPHVTRLQPIMGWLVGATVDEVLAVGGGLRLFRSGLRLISLGLCVSGGGLSLVRRILRGLRSRIGLDSRIGRVGRCLVGHSHPSRPIPAFWSVRAIRGVNPQGSRLAHRRGRRRALDEHVGLAVSHASGGGSSRIRLLCRIGRVRGGLGRTVSRGLRLSRHARSVRGGGLRIRSVRLGRNRVGLGGIGRSVGGVGQRLGIASGLLRAFGGGLRGIGRILGLTCGSGGALRGGSSRIGGILSGLRRTIGRVSRALRVFRCGGGVLSGLLGVGGLRRVVRDIRLSLGNFVRVLLDIGIAEMVPIRAIPYQGVDHAVGQWHEHARTVVRLALPVRVEVGQHGRRIIFLPFPASPILLGLEPQVTDDEIVLRLVGTTESMVLAMGFGIRLRSRLLSLADLPVRRGQVAFGLCDVLPRLRQIGLRLRERLGRRIKAGLVGLDVLPRLIQLRRIIPQRGVGRVDDRLVRLDVRLRGFKLFRRGRLRGLIRGDILPRLRQLGRIVLQSRLIVGQILLDSFDLFRRDRRSHGDSGDCRPVGTIASMVDGTQGVGVL